MSEGTHPFLYLGEVTNRDDPDGLGRVRVLIPAVCEPESAWAFPMGAPGAGTAERGHFEPPAVGANVMVQFLLGDVDHPYYMPGPWGDPEGVSDVPIGGVVEEGENRQRAVTEDAEWLIARDSRSGDDQKQFLIEHKDSGLHFELNANPTAPKWRQDMGDSPTQKPFVELDATPSAFKARLDSGECPAQGPSIELRCTNQIIEIDTGVGPSITLNGAAGQIYISLGSPPEIAFEGDETFLGDRNATKKAMLGDDYRADEAAFLAALCAALQAFATACKAAVVEPALGPAALALEGVMLATPVVDSKVRTDATHAAYLSQKVKVQE
jgi:hypothetical protein